MRSEERNALHFHCFPLPLIYRVDSPTKISIPRLVLTSAVKVNALTQIHFNSTNFLTRD